MSVGAVRVPKVSTALYRRYRPETFEDVIGQEHVTEPLMQALRTGRVNHAYLFSGPRGCGKTTSARILARCLNCEKGPTPTPCGECDSCVALSRGGAGSVDVIEIDAASHGGVDDARDLREKASYGPAQSRYKVYIIDEAHMVTPQGFNALLKIVEEPPEHVKFIFATTEPEKVIGTIRSRTHHYPFRLVPPARLSDYMAELCRREGVTVAPGVLSFVVRAGGGSVRDSLSILDQLIAGSGESGLTYEGAAALLGFTDGELLDAVVNAFAAGDAATVFASIDKVIETGQDPRRFVEDVLERLRDLIVVAAVPDGAASVLRGIPEDQVERMRTQAAAFGAGSLSRAADIVNAGLTEMTGATAPRLQLELIAARVLLPGAAGESGYAARIDRLERRLDVGGVPTGARMPASSPPAPVAPLTSSPDQYPAAPSTGSPSAGATRPGATSTAQPPQGSTPAGPESTSRRPAQGLGDGPPLDEPPPSDEEAPPEPAAGSLDVPAGQGRPGGRSPSDGRTQEGELSPAGQDAGPASTGEQLPAEPVAPPGATGLGPGGLDVAAIRRAWPDVLAKIFVLKRTTWTLLSAHAQVFGYDGQRLSLSLPTSGLLTAFGSGPHAELVRQALIDVLGVDARVDGVLAQPGSAGAPVGRSGAPGVTAAPQGTRPSAQGGGGGRTADDGPPSGTTGANDPARGAGAPGARPGSKGGPTGGPSARPGSTGGHAEGSSPAADATGLGWSPESRSRTRDSAGAGDWATSAPPSATAPSWATADVHGPSSGGEASPRSASGASGAPGAPGPEPAGSVVSASPRGAGAQVAPSPEAGGGEGAGRGGRHLSAVPDASSPVPGRSVPDDIPDEDLVSDDDEAVDEAAESGQSVVERLLGGTVIDEIED